MEKIKPVYQPWHGKRTSVFIIRTSKLITIMSDLTSLLNELLSKHNSHCSSHPRKRSDTRDEFLKEAYRIVNTHQYQARVSLFPGIIS